MFKISPVDKIRNAEFQELGLSQITVLLTFQDAEERSTIDVTFSPDAEKFNQHYRIEDEP